MIHRLCLTLLLHEFLTDSKFFGGSNKDLTEARQFNYCPILRKDFVVNEYQIIEAKSIGADVVLLIATVLSKEEIKLLTTLAVSLGLEVLLEIHEAEELEKAPYVIFSFSDDIELNIDYLKMKLLVAMLNPDDLQIEAAALLKKRETPRFWKNYAPQSKPSAT